MKILNVKANIIFDKTKPDGTPRKLLDISRLKNFGWIPKITLQKGIEKSYKWYLQQVEKNSLIANL